MYSREAIEFIKNSKPNPTIEAIKSSIASISKVLKAEREGKQWDLRSAVPDTVVYGEAIKEDSANGLGRIFKRYAHAS